MDAATITLVLSAITALGAAAAAIGSWISARATKNAAQAQLLFSLYEQYSSPEMLRSLRLLRKWQHDHGSDFADRWINGLRTSDPDAQEIDHARRRVKGYFLQAVRLWESGFASKRFLQHACGMDGIHVLYEVVEPLEQALNPRYEARRFQLLRRLVGTRIGSGGLVEAFPPPQHLPGKTQPERTPLPAESPDVAPQ